MQVRKLLLLYATKYFLTGYLINYTFVHQMRQKQITLFKSHAKSYCKSYGGVLLNTRNGRAMARPLDTKNTMHLVLRSSKAVGEWSFKRSKNESSVRRIMRKFAYKFGVHILSLAVVGNHLHMHIKLTNRYTYRPFIRAVTSAIAMAITGVNRWTKSNHKQNLRFWDYRPFTRVIQSFRDRLQLDDYIQINALEGIGYSRIFAKVLLGFNSG